MLQPRTAQSLVLQISRMYIEPMSDGAKKNWNKTYQARKMVSTLDYAKNAYRHLQSQPRCMLLDIGCGDGRDSMYFSEQGVNVTAIDFSEEAIGKLQTRFPDINALVKDILHMDFPDTSFDAIYAHLSLHYFDDPTTDAVLCNIRRMMKHNGLFFIRCKSIHDPLYGKGREINEDMFLFHHTRHFFSAEYMREKLRDFEILSLEETASSYEGKDSCFVEAIARKTH